MSLSQLIHELTINESNIKFTESCYTEDFKIVEKMVSIGLIDYTEEAFIISCSNGNLQIFKKLLPYFYFDSSVLISGFENACIFGKIKIVDELLSVSNISNIYKNNVVGLQQAINSLNVELIDKLVKYYDINEISIEFSSFNRINSEVCKYLILKDIKLTYINNPRDYYVWYYLYKKGLYKKSSKVVLIQNFKKFFNEKSKKI